jgi:hypothetical protein
MWRHASGWIVQHCGHPTANWPYYLVSPQGDSPIIASHGHCFRTLQEAKAAVEGLHAGIYLVNQTGQVVERTEA